MANTKQPENAFQLSQLRDILNIDDKDLLLVSDYEPNGCFTRKMTVGRFVEELAKRVKSDAKLKAAVEQAVAAAVEKPGAVEQAVESKIEEQISEMVLDASAED